MEQMKLVKFSKKFKITPIVNSRWKTEFLANISSAFNDKQESKKDSENVEIEKLYAQISQFKVENDFLKKIARN